MSIPNGHRLQIGSQHFKFDIITSSRAFQARLADAISRDLVRDVTDDKYSNLSEQELDQLNEQFYIKVVQKSPSWLKLRARAQGTASSVGKYLMSSCRFPDLAQIKEAWMDKITHAPFNKTHTMLGHMNWGVGYEDPALIHFATELGVGVSQSGTIRIGLDYILALGQQIYKKDWIDLGLQIEGQHLLISPDGIVGKPERTGQNGIQTSQYREVLGMLEIKCISPFYHIETEDGYLEWTIDMESRQWTEPEQIPFVYVSQIALQAISGVHSLNMNANSKMWFIRWSPRGFSLFTFRFGQLIKLGTLVASLYFSLLQRTHSLEDIERLYPLRPAEFQVEKMMNAAYKEVMKNATWRYVPISEYSEFAVYQDVTQYFKFIIPEIDPDSLMIQMPVQNPSTSTGIGTEDLNNVCLLPAV